MSGAISFGGLVSGLDTNSMVDQMVAAEELPNTGYQQHITNDNTKLSTLGTLISQVQALNTAAQGLATSIDVNPLTTTSSNSGVVTATATAASGATTGSYSLTVSQLAQAQENISTGSATDAVPGDGSLSITVGSSQTPLQVTYSANDTLESVATKINALGGGVTASVLNDGTNYHLVLSSTQTGTANGMTFAETGDGLGFNADGAELVKPLDAMFTLNNVPVTRSTNNITDAVPGLTFNLTGTTPDGGGATTIGVSLDQATLQTKVQALVDSYNAVQKTLSGQLSYTAGSSTLGPNTFFGDSGFEQLSQSIAGIFAGGYGKGALSAAQLGITLNEDGSLAFDTSTFSTEMTSDPSAAQQLFTGDSNGEGLAQVLTSTLDSYTAPVDGTLTNEQTALNTEVTNYQTLITQTTAAGTALGVRMRGEFAAMESALSQIESQSAILTALGGGASATTATPTSTASSASSASSSSSSSSSSTGSTSSSS